MTEKEFEELQRKFASSGKTLKSFLKATGVAYSTYNYWSRKIKSESEPKPIAPITLYHGQPACGEEPSMDMGGIPGVTLAFPNGVRAHFGSGSERVLIDVLTKSMGHVLP